MKVRFVNCSWKNSWVSRLGRYTGPRVPLLLELHNTSRTQRPGGVEFVDCHVYDDVAGPVIEYDDVTRRTPLADVSGQITAHGRGLADPLLGPNVVHVTLEVRHAP